MYMVGRFVRRKVTRVILLIAAIAAIGASGFGLKGLVFDYPSPSEVVGKGSKDFSYSEVPEYSGELYCEVNGNFPYFTEDEKADTGAFEIYSELDSLGRCGTAFANVCKKLMPTEKRGDIGSIKPTGWEQKKYKGLVNSDPPYLYNRCHLIAYSLAGENANKRNLITGTRKFNAEGMLGFENSVAKYVDKHPKNHVLYRVTPVFEGDDLVARGVLMEAWSVEDAGEGICFCVFVYNAQPGIEIDYSTGKSHRL